jgi:multidrug efflux pump subunit AcrA (membrane-fusion protein)
MPTADVKRVLAVPRDALILRREGASVFTVASDMTVEQVRVITGLGDGNYIEIIGDLTAGDRVVTRGGERLNSGMKVSSNGNPTTNGVGNAVSN